MKFFRGIAVPRAAAEKKMADIRHQGLTERGPGSQFAESELKGRLDDLRSRERVGTRDTRAEDTRYVCVCASGEPEGALFYAHEHNRSDENDTPILISFEANSWDVSVDGRDFLTTVFQLGGPGARDILASIFGPGVLEYAERAWAREDQDERIALCDLARHDERVIAAHALNRISIGGRFGTVFRSAFLVRLPVNPERIVDVRVLEDDVRLPVPEVTLNSALGR